MYACMHACNSLFYLCYAELNKAKTMADLNIAAFGQPSLCIDTKPPYSPADVASYLPDVKFPTEDDVLHCKILPTFNDMLSCALFTPLSLSLFVVLETQTHSPFF